MSKDHLYRSDCNLHGGNTLLASLFLRTPVDRLSGPIDEVEQSLYHPPALEGNVKRGKY